MCRLILFSVAAALRARLNEANSPRSAALGRAIIHRNRVPASTGEGRPAVLQSVSECIDHLGKCGRRAHDGGRAVSHRPPWTCYCSDTHHPDASDGRHSDPTLPVDRGRRVCPARHQPPCVLSYVASLLTAWTPVTSQLQLTTTPLDAARCAVEEYDRVVTDRCMEGEDFIWHYMNCEEPDYRINDTPYVSRGSQCITVPVDAVVC